MTNLQENYFIPRFEVAIKEAQVQNAKNDMLEEAKAMIRVSKHDHIVNIQRNATEDPFGWRHEVKTTVSI